MRLLVIRYVSKSFEIIENVWKHTATTGTNGRGVSIYEAIV